MTQSIMDLSRADGPSRLPAGLRVTGDLTTNQDLTIDGIYEGQITLMDQNLTISATARVKGRIIARTVTVAGTVDATVVASGRVSLQTTASVRGHLQTPMIVMAEGARFDGTVDPTRSVAAMQVAKYRQRQG